MTSGLSLCLVSVTISILYVYDSKPTYCKKYQVLLNIIHFVATLNIFVLFFAGINVVSTSSTM